MDRSVKSSHNDNFKHLELRQDRLHSLAADTRKEVLTQKDLSVHMLALLPCGLHFKCSNLKQLSNVQQENTGNLEHSSNAVYLVLHVTVTHHQRNVS